MARIRSIKPSIWTDQRFIRLSVHARLLCIGMISMADDEGRLFASTTKLAGDIFPSDNFTPKQIAGWREEITHTGLVDVYEVDGVEYAQFPRWKKHQRISKPQPSALPSRNADTTDCGTIPHRVVESLHGQPHPSRTGARRVPPAHPRQETGDRRQETGVVPTTSTTSTPSAHTTAQQLLAEHLDGFTQRPPQRVIGQTASLIGQLLGEGIAPNDVRAGLLTVRRKALHPSALPSAVNDALNPPAATSDQRFAQGRAVAAELREAGL